MSSTAPLTPTAVASCCPPAKLNLFLELLARRDDGYHEIDTVMVPINWRDRLQLRRTPQPGITLRVQWLPSRQAMANRLGLACRSHEAAGRLLDIPTGDDNLVVGALRRFSAVLGIEGGFACELDKTIPPGAGMGGASSDAAAALRCAASVCGIPSRAPELFQIAAEIGSDVPFFLGDPAALAGSGRDSMDAARATGRGERLQRIELATALYFVVVYPGICLPTGKVYANSLVPSEPQTSCRLIEAIGRGNLRELSREMTNRLSEGAKKLAPPVDEILESLWRLGLRTCQLTGSGSACFAIVRSARQSRRIAARVRAMLEPGAIVVAARSTRVPAPIVMSMT